MFRKVVATLTFVLLITLTSTAQANDFDIHEFYPIENSHSYIEFSVKYMGYAKIKGKFEKFNGTFKYDENDISKTSVSLSIAVNSIDTDHNWRDKDLKSKNWFDAEKFSTITFISNKVNATEEGFEIIGDLTIKETTKEVIIKMNPASGILKDTRGDSQVILSGETTINRKDFGIEGKRWSALKEGITGVADEIKIEVSILGKQIKLKNFKNWVRNETRPPGKIYKEISTNGLAAGLRIFEEMRTDSETKLNSNALNIVGYVLLREGKTKEALKVFKKNIEAFSEESFVYDSYAEALATSGNLTEAKSIYKKSFEMDGGNQNAGEILRHLK